MARLSDKQMRAIAILAQPKRGGLTYEQVAEQVGVDKATLWRWRKDDKFNDELKREIVRLTIDSLPDIMASVPEHIIRDGNAALFRTLLQAHGILTEKVEIETKESGRADIDEVRAKLAQYKDGETS